MPIAIRVSYRSKSPGRRIDQTHCVLLPDERWRWWPPGSPLLQYLTGPLHSFFLAQTLVEAGEPWPHGEWGHGEKGILQYYCEILETTDFRVIKAYLECIAAKKAKGHWSCPCGSNKRLRDCHFGAVADLREKISRKDALNSLKALKKKQPANTRQTQPL